MKCAVVVFAKTPGFSKYKTRLAKDIGSELTEKFYHLSIKATKSYLSSLENKMNNVNSYFAIAEKEALGIDFWSDISTLAQADGGLGIRQHKIQKKLHETYDCVFFIGADTPHLNSIYLQKIIREFITSKKNFLIGPSTDGGYYIFGSKQVLDEEIWTSIEYSVCTTAQQFTEKLGGEGLVDLVDSDFDVDDLDSLKGLRNVIRHELTLEQIQVLDFADEICLTHSLEIV